MVLRHEKQNGVDILCRIQMYVRLSSCHLIQSFCLWLSNKMQSGPLDTFLM